VELEPVPFRNNIVTMQGNQEPSRGYVVWRKQAGMVWEWNEKTIFGMQTNA